MPEYLAPIIDWLNSFSALALILSIIAVLYLIRMLWIGGKKALPGLKSAISFVEALFRLPVFMAETTQSLREVRHEVLPNNGDSMRDDVETVMLMVEQLSNRVGSVEEHDQSDHQRLLDLEHEKELERTIIRRREYRKQIQSEETPNPFPQDTTEE